MWTSSSPTSTSVRRPLATPAREGPNREGKRLLRLVGRKAIAFARYRSSPIRRRAASGLSSTDCPAVSIVRRLGQREAASRLTNLRNYNTDGFDLQTNGNGRGGTCSADSGGPVFYGGFSSNTIVAVTSFGLNPYCRGVDFSYRTDRQEVIDWILEHAPEDEADDIRIVEL